MYTPGRDPLVFTVRGLRFGCALGMETHYPELFCAYEELDVECVLFSTAGSPQVPGVFAIEAAGHAAANSIWISYAGPAQAGHPPAGVARPDGTWASRCDTSTSALAVTELEPGAGAHARAWRRTHSVSRTDLQQRGHRGVPVPGGLAWRSLICEEDAATS